MQRARAASVALPFERLIERPCGVFPDQRRAAFIGVLRLCAGNAGDGQGEKRGGEKKGREGLLRLEHGR